MPEEPSILQKKTKAQVKAHERERNILTIIKQMKPNFNSSGAKIQAVDDEVWETSI